MELQVGCDVGANWGPRWKKDVESMSLNRYNYTSVCSTVVPILVEMMDCQSDSLYSATTLLREGDSLGSESIALID